jgi:hypothetical protein
VLLGLAEASSSEATAGKERTTKASWGWWRRLCCHLLVLIRDFTITTTLSKDAFQQMQEPAILESEKTKAVLWDVEALANKW